MKRLIGAAFVAGALAVAGPGAIDSAAAAPQAKAQRAGTSDATDFSAHRRHYRRYYRQLRPIIARTTGPTTTTGPIYYRPYPYDAPAPFIFGIGSWSGLVVSRARLVTDLADTISLR